MSTRLWGVGTFPVTNDPKKRIVTITTLFAAFSISVFVITELVSVLVAIVWAISATLVLPTIVTSALWLILGVPTLWVAVVVAIFAFNAETDPENNRESQQGGTSDNGEIEPGATPPATTIAH